MSIKFDLIIANPPYGSIGANITKNIIDNIDFGEYVNLLPANDYKRNTEKNLFQYAREMESINDGFKDAMVTTHLCKIVRDANDITLDEFEIMNYTDPSLTKYFTANRARKDFKAIYKPTFKEFDQLAIEETIYIPKRLVKNQHFAYDMAVLPNLYNLNKIDKQYVIDNSAKSEQSLGNVGDFYLIVVTKQEKDNFVNFIYSKNGFKFMSKVLTAVNADSAVSVNKYLPKVDWVKSWTVEEILEDYGYTELEIKDIMKDLDNFRGMDD